MKYFIHIAYKGANYRGWQRQPNAPSIQAVLEDAIRKMTGQGINCIGCGRTDAGVHASQFFCHIVIGEKFGFDPVFRLNKMLPNDIAVFDFIEMPREAHAQHDATSRTYSYFFHGTKDPFLNEVSTFYSFENLDFSKMEAAVALLTEHRDFKAFCKQPNLYKSTKCKVVQASLARNTAAGQFRFQITADRFLRGMVRILAANILEVGHGKMGLQAFGECLATGRKPPYFREAFPQGLHLSAVEYPFLKTVARKVMVGELSTEGAG